MIYVTGNHMGGGWRVEGGKNKTHGKKFLNLPFTLHPLPAHAFSLVEMLIVLAIIAMIMAISVPFTSGFGKGLRVKTTARAIAGIMNVARSNAVTFRKKYSVVFDVKKSQYWIEDEADHVYEKKYFLPGPIKFEIKGDKEADPITFENDKVTFNSSGAVEGVSGAVTFTDKQGGSRTISVTGATGKIVINNNMPI